MAASHRIAEDHNLILGIQGFSYADLYKPSRLADLLNVFDTTLKVLDAGLFAEYQTYKNTLGKEMAPQAISDLLVRLAPHVGEFVARLFHVEAERANQQSAIRDEVETIFVFRNEIIEKIQARFKDADITRWDIKKIQGDIDLLKRIAFPETATDTDLEHAFCRVGSRLARLSNHYRALARGKPAEINDADSEVNTLQQRLEADPQSKVAFAAALAKQEPAEFTDVLLEAVQRWCYAALNDPELNKIISFYGDNHPVYAGNVVKAMASAKDGYPYIVRLFAQELISLDPAQQQNRDQSMQSLLKRLEGELTATVVELNRLTPLLSRSSCMPPCRPANSIRDKFTGCRISRVWHRLSKALYSLPKVWP